MDISDWVRKATVSDERLAQKVDRLKRRLHTAQGRGVSFSGFVRRRESSQENKEERTTTDRSEEKHTQRKSGLSLLLWKTSGDVLYQSARLRTANSRRQNLRESMRRFNSSRRIVTQRSLRHLLLRGRGLSL